MVIRTDCSLFMFRSVPIGVIYSDNVADRFRPPNDRTDEDGFLMVAVPSTLAFALAIAGSVATSLGLETSATYFAAAGILTLSLLIIGGAAFFGPEPEVRETRGRIRTWLTGLVVGMGVLVLVNGLVLTGLVVRFPTPS